MGLRRRLYELVPRSAHVRIMYRRVKPTRDGTLLDRATDTRKMRYLLTRRVVRFVRSEEKLRAAMDGRAE